MDSNGDAVDNEGTNQIRWGDPATSDGQSGYNFDATAAGTVLPEEQLFILGTFNHLNFPVYPPSLASADLTISMSGNADGVGFSFNSTFSFEHTETPNNPSSGVCAEGGAQPCPDLVTLLNPQDTSQIVTVGGVDYTLEIVGFVEDETDWSSFLDSFLTLEGQENEAYLLARFSEPPVVNEVPLPAAGWMLLASIGGMAAFRRKTSMH